MVPCGAVSSAIQGADVCVSARCPQGSYLTGFSCQVTRGHATGFYVSDASGKDAPTGPLAQVICTAKSTNDHKQAHIWAAAICQSCTNPAVVVPPIGVIPPGPGGPGGNGGYPGGNYPDYGYPGYGYPPAGY